MPYRNARSMIMTDHHIYRLITALIGVLLMTGAANAERTITISSVCPLYGEQYQTMEYITGQLHAVPEEADLVALPYMPFLSFETGNARAQLEAFADFAESRGTNLTLALTEHDGDDTYASAVLIDRDGHLSGKYRKAHALADDDISLGDALPVFETDFGTVGMTIGTDFFIPEIYEVMRMKGAEVLTWHHYPQRLRDHTGWDCLLMARCLDSHAQLVASMYADENTYIAHRWRLHAAGAVLGRSMVLNRVGLPLADTGHAQGVATATVDLDRRKKNVWGPDHKKEDIFYVNHYGDRGYLAPVAEPYEKPETPEYEKRTCRLAIAYLDPQHMWRKGEEPEPILKLIEQAKAIEPDLLLFSENASHLDDEANAGSMAMLAQKADELDCYLAVGGIGRGEYNSVCHVWNREGELIYTEPICWPAGMPEANVFYTDFGCVGAHSCGDLYIPLLDRVLALKGAEIIIDPSMMHGATGRYNEKMLRARALDNAVWTACAHWNSSDPTLRSVIIDPYGQVMAASKYQHEGIVYTDIDLSQKRVYYAGKRDTQKQPGDRSYAAYRTGDLPAKKQGWREMVFAARRPNLYSIIPTVNDVIMEYRDPDRE